MINWHPIETAPKDRPVLLGWMANGAIAHQVISRWRNNHWEGGWTPTHWANP